MSLITIKIPAASASFLIRAIELYADSLKNNIMDGLNAPNWVAQLTDNKVVASQKTKDAPYGLKADGTPKKRPGRKPRKASK